jgi:hypothetical protein
VVGLAANSGLHKPANNATASQNCVFRFNEVVSFVPVQLAPDCRTFYATLSSPQTRYCFQAVTAVPKFVLQNLVTTGYYAIAMLESTLYKWHAEGHFHRFFEIQLCAASRGTWRPQGQENARSNVQSDANQRRKRSPEENMRSIALDSDE